MLWNINSHFAEVAVDVFYKDYIALGLWGDEGGISEYNLYLSRTLVSSVDMTAKIEVVFCCVYVNYFWQVYSASIPELQENYCLTKMQHTLTLASLLKHTALGPEQSNFSQ